MFLGTVLRGRLDLGGASIPLTCVAMSPSPPLSRACKAFLVSDMVDRLQREPDIQSDLRPGVRTDGVVTFGKVDPSRPLEVRLEWYSDNYNITAHPIVFQVRA